MVVSLKKYSYHLLHVRKVSQNGCVLPKLSEAAKIRIQEFLVLIPTDHAASKKNQIMLPLKVRAKFKT